MAVLACPLVLALACGDDDSGGNGNEGGRSSEGGAPSDGGAAGASGGARPEGGSAGSSGGGSAGEGGAPTTGGSAGDGGTRGGESGSAGESGAPTTGGRDGTGGVGTGGTIGEGGSGGVGGAGAGNEPLVLTVVTKSDVHAISPHVYGATTRNVACDARFTVCRQGGNRWSGYNWENNATNAGADSNRCSENTPDISASDTPALPVTDLLDATTAVDAAAIVTVPMLPYVAADKTTGTPYPTCSGDVRKSGADYKATRLRENKATKNEPFEYPPDTTDQVVYQDEFIAHLLAHQPEANVLFTLDNQPELWPQTHAALVIDESPTEYAQIVQLGTTYATMIKATWPGALVTGPATYGWQGFLNLQNAPDAGNAQFLDYYLASMREAGDTAGMRLLDYLDVHWFSVVDVGGSVVSDFVDDGSPELAAVRVQAPRSLYEPNYREPSWIGDNYGAIRLIPWLKQKIATFYPGTKLAISAWAYGGEAAMSGGIAAADALGIFGREAVDLATFDANSTDNSFALAAFAAFRNYDGAGSAFGDQSVRATSNRPSDVTIYASTDSRAPGRVVIIAINKNLQPLTGTLDVQDSHTFTAADVYVLTEDAAEVRAAGDLTATSNNAFEYELPARSVSVIVPRG